MNAKWKVLGGSLAGAVAIHAVLAACSSNHRGGTGSGTGGGHDSGFFDALVDAIAGQEAGASSDSGAPPTCTAWQVTSTQVASQTLNLPAGQEPFAVTNPPQSNLTILWTRSCQ